MNQLSQEYGIPSERTSFFGTHLIINDVLDLLESVKRSIDADDANAIRALSDAASLLQGEVSGVASLKLRLVTKGGLAGWQIKRLKDYIETRLEEQISVLQLSEIAALSTSHFARAFRANFGMAPHSYIVSCRVKKAKQMILMTSLPLSQIALCCGFSDQSHLCQTFRKKCDMAPLAWRRQTIARLRICKAESAGHLEAA